MAPESLRRWRDQSDATAAAETKQSAQEAMAELRRLRAENTVRRANEILTTASAFFRGQARPDTALMAAYIDEYRNRFKVGPICRVLSEALDCGFLTPRGCRMFRSRPVSRMRARHGGAGPRRHGHPCRRVLRRVRMPQVWHELIGKGWDPGEVGRDQR